MFRCVAGLCVVIGVAAVAAAGAGATAEVSAPLPPLSALVLAPSDFAAGGRIESQSTKTVGREQMFTRLLSTGRIGSTTFLVAASLALVEPDEPTATLGYSELKAVTQTKAGRDALAKEFGREFVSGIKGGKAKIKLKSSTVGAPALLGADAFRLPITLKTNLGSLHMPLEVTQTDRVVAILALIPFFNRSARTADSTAALTAVQHHLHDAFTVANTSPPTTTGTATQGQVLTLDEGSWTGVPSSFTYAWSHCDAAGANCAPIAGATAKTYTVGAADVGFTLRVTVTGTNSVGSQQGVSSATPVVT